MTTLVPVLTPHGRLTIVEAGEGLALEPKQASHLASQFARGAGHGLLYLGADEVGSRLPPELSYWREFAARYMAAVCALPDIGEDNRPVKSALPPPSDENLRELVASAPPMRGAEYLTPAILADLWRVTDAAFDAERAEAKLSVQAFVKSRHPAWNLVGRVHFHLAENGHDDDAPFAFLATYTTRLSSAAKAQHMPLGKALQEYSGAKNRDRLLSLLLPVQRAAQTCSWLKGMVDTGEIFHPLRWTPQHALRFLKDASTIESAGVIVRMPASWRMNRPPRPQVRATVGAVAPSTLGMDALLDFAMEVTLEGETLSKAELERLLAETEGLAFIRGKWVEVDRERLSQALEQFTAVERRAKADGLSFAEAMRLMAGAGIPGSADDQGASDWTRTVAGPWLEKTLAALRDPDAISQVDPGELLNGTLRPYQRTGVYWLHMLSQLKLGACLADDMGLGKTIQVLGLLLMLKNEAVARPWPSLLVAPASLLANWAAETARFAPSLRTHLAHPSAGPTEPASGERDSPADADFVITSYGYLQRSPSLLEIGWRLVVLDEAQAIKNPSAKQTQAVKRLHAGARIALTGTPIENRLGDLWSIFDFVNPGLLGSAKQFSTFAKRLADRPHNAYGPLRDLVRPYILRRLKTDPQIISDLPDKTEVKAFCSLSRKQAALYGQAIDEMERQLEVADGMKRRGLVLALLMRLKQICNHPSQWLGDGSWAENDSGKFARLREIVEVTVARQEKVLVFTQFKEVTKPLAEFLASVCGRPGLVLHGETQIAKRQDLVRRFQTDESIPFFVLSVKVGGTGLNLTAASHVIHYDRWWNPAVENQATDRAFRIGQTKNVLVHKFVCRGTVEDKIDRLIESKQQLAGDFLGGGAELLLTEMKTEELLRLVSLDLRAAMSEG